MEDVKELIEELKKIREKSDKLCRDYFFEERIISINLGIVTDDIQAGIERLEKGLERPMKKWRVA